MAYLLADYDAALEYILENGIEKRDRTGVGVIGVAGIQSRYRLDTGHFPVLTRRKVYPKSAFAELLWFLSGSTKNRDLVALGAKFWGKWCDEGDPKYAAFRERWWYEPGDLGPVYGWQLRHFGASYIRHNIYRRVFESGYPNFASLAGKVDTEVYDCVMEAWDNWRGKEDLSVRAQAEKDSGVDQLRFMVDILKDDPYGPNGRRCMFSLWNPADIEKMALPPCHFTYQAVVDGRGGLTGILTQRSCDFSAGAHYNIAFYSALTIMLAQQSGLKAVELVHNTNDSNIYLDQIEGVREYLSRPKPDCPRLEIRPAPDIFSYTTSDFSLKDYEPLPAIEVPVAV